MGDIATVEQVLDIRTGELIPASDIDRVADVLRHLRDYRQQLLHAAKQCEAIIVDESRRRGTKTLHLVGADAMVYGGQETEWDVDVLGELLEAGLPEPRFGELVTIEQTFKVNARVAQQIAAANETYAGIVGRAKSTVEKPYRVKIT